MANEWESLIALQQVDIQIYKLKQEQKKYPDDIATLKQDISRAYNAVEALNARLAAALTEKKSIEDKIVEANKFLDKSHTLLNEIKTNKEYDAVHVQIENFKKTINTAETRLKAIVQEIEQLQASAEMAASELESIKQADEPQLCELNDKMNALDGLINNSTVERNTIAALVSKPLMRTYDYISKRRKNSQVLSFINNTNCNCSVCHKIMESQLLNEVRKMTKMMTCQSCGSILVWEKNELEHREP